MTQPNPSSRKRFFKSVEIYVPNERQRLSELCTWLRQKLSERSAGVGGSGWLKILDDACAG